jgi:hypothetical protein
MPNAPGWYPDPTGRPVPRWWNGTAWAQDVPPPPSGHPGPFDTAPLPTGYVPALPPKRPWYRRTTFLVIATVLAVIVLLAVVGAAVESGSRTGSSNPPQAVVPDPVSSSRPDTFPSSARTSSPATVPPTQTPKPTSLPPTTDASADGSWIMPNEVGRVLQDAQDDVQHVSGDPAFFSHSHDELGTRLQILDDNWQVCDQNVAAGQRVSAVAHIDFGVVKTDESCP